MAYGKRTDSTHSAIRKALRRAGWIVWDTSGSAHTIGGRGNPDLVAGRKEKGYVALWVKKPGGKYTPSEQKAIDRGDPLLFVESVEQALNVIGVRYG